MSSPQTRGLIALGMLVAAACVLWALQEPEPESGFDLQAPRAEAPAGTAARATPDDTAAPEREARAPVADGIPRLLPPDAAVEDLRDALALPEPARTRQVQRAYESLTQAVRQSEPMRRGLIRYLTRLEDPVARGIVMAALGANASPENRAWLCERLRVAASPAERLGALLGLGYGTSKGSARATSLAGLRYPMAGLPTERASLVALADWLDDADGDAARDSLPLLLEGVQRSVEIATLLVVRNEERTCRAYGVLAPAEQARLREAALEHEELPGIVRHVLETP